MKHLDPLHYEALRAVIAEAKMNTLVAQQVLLRQVSGEVYVDSPDAPATALVRHPYGMALIFAALPAGDLPQDFRAFALNRDGWRSSAEWLQIAPTEAQERFDALVEDKLRVAAQDEAPDTGPRADAAVIKYERINFAFDQEHYEARRRPDLPPGYTVVETMPEIFDAVTGHVVPSKFWNNAADFARMGAGFSVLSPKGEALSTAFASFVVGDKLELGVETKAEHHGAGLGTAACSALIDYCLERGYEPVWSCHSGNHGSRKLADRLGFREALRVPYYRLPAVSIHDGS